VIPVVLDWLGLDPEGYRAWTAIGLVARPNDELLADYVPPRSAIYFLGEGGFLVRACRDE
jgi:hypothetical protein